MSTISIQQSIKVASNSFPVQKPCVTLSVTYYQKLGIHFAIFQCEYTRDEHERTSLICLCINLFFSVKGRT